MASREWAVGVPLACLQHVNGIHESGYTGMWGVSLKQWGLCTLALGHGVSLGLSVLSVFFTWGQVYSAQALGDLSSPLLDFHPQLFWHIRTPTAPTPVTAADAVYTSDSQTTYITTPITDNPPHTHSQTHT